MEFRMRNQPAAVCQVFLEGTIRMWFDFAFFCVSLYLLLPIVNRMA